MSYLVMVSLVWAFSFGLIGNHLAGLPPAWVGWIRLALSAGVFLPFVRRVPWKIGLGLFATGAVQFGLMYLAYLTSFRFLKSHEVALFTVTTPILVALLSDLAPGAGGRAISWPHRWRWAEPPSSSGLNWKAPRRSSGSCSCKPPTCALPQAN